MKFYYSGKKPDARGEIMIHSEGCEDLPDILGRIYLGIFPNGYLAVSSAKEKLQLARVVICKCCE